jgi:Flp pilus assembly protein TadD
VKGHDAITYIRKKFIRMTHRKAAPEILSIPLSELNPGIVPADVAPGTAEFEQAILLHYSMLYAARGWQAAVKVQDGFLWCVAIPERGMDPKDYVIGLLQNGFLEDGLPLLQALDGMFEDAEIAYNLGICYSELGKIPESLEPLQRCTRLDPGHVNAWVGLGVAYTRLGRNEEAMTSLLQAIKLDPSNPYAQRNLGALLMKADRFEEALPHLREAVILAPSDPAAQMGLAQCLEQLGGSHRNEADSIYTDLINRFPSHPIAEMARTARTHIAQDNLHQAVSSEVRMDAVFYMQDALQRFATMEPAEVGQVTMEIAVLGRQGLKINDPEQRYHLNSLPGEFSGLHLLCLMHVGIRQFDPKGETGTGLDKEYAMARSMTGSGA